MRTPLEPRAARRPQLDIAGHLRPHVQQPCGVHDFQERVVDIPERLAHSLIRFDDVPQPIAPDRSAAGLRPVLDRLELRGSFQEGGRVGIAIRPEAIQGGEVGRAVGAAEERGVGVRVIGRDELGVACPGT